MGLAPCSPFSVSTDLMRESASLAREYGVRLHTHLAENAEDIAYSESGYGMRPATTPRAAGWTGEDVWHAHCVQLNDDERAAFAASGTGHFPLPLLQYAIGLWHRTGGSLVGARRTRKSGCGRLSLQRRRRHDR